jgi:hypothetical protein
MRFEDYITEGRNAGEDLEDGIIHVWNHYNGRTRKLREPFPTTLNKKVTEDGCIKIVEFLRKHLKSKAKAHSYGQKHGKTSAFWAQHFPGGRVPGATKTPKTDILIGKHRISLKAGNAAQLMSGAKGETTATFYAALEKSGVKIGPVIKDVEKYLNDMSTRKVAAGKVEDVKEAMTDEILLMADETNKRIMEKLGQLFSTNPKFKKAFAYEAMTGEVKFDNTDAACTHFLVSAWDGGKNKYKSCSDSSYITDISAQMSMNISFKSSSVKVKGEKTGEYGYWSVTRLAITKMLEEVDRHGHLLTEGIISNIMSKVKSFMSKIFRNVISFIQKSFDNFMSFMGLTPVVQVNQNIQF